MRLRFVIPGAFACLFGLPSAPAAAGEPPMIYVAKAEGDEPTLLVRFGEFTNQGSPDWSPDGSRIAFDARRPSRGDTLPDTHIIAVDASGAEPRDLGPGAMPSWSHDSLKLAFSQYEPRGVYVMNADGSDRRLLAADGWCGRWSPDGKTIAYTVYRGNVADICLHDVETERKRYVFEGAGQPYQTIYWSFCWSPDSKRLCFLGVTPANERQVATVSTAGPREHLHVHHRGATSGAFAWHPGGDRILMAMQTPIHRFNRLHTAPADGSAEPSPLLGLPEDLAATAGDWSPDGTRLLLNGAVATVGAP